MNIIDIIFIIPLAWFTYVGFKKGLIIELFSLVALILGIYAALHFSFYAENFLIANLNINDQYIPIASFIVTFIIVVLLVFVLGKIIEKFINVLALGFLNKLAGSAFGLLKSALIISVVLILINNVNISLISEERKENSLLYRPVESIAPLLWSKMQDLDIGGLPLLNHLPSNYSYNLH